MSFDYYYMGKKMTKSCLISIVGKQRVDRVVKEAKEIVMRDPNIGLDWADGISLVLKF